MSFSSWSDPSRPARFSARALWLERTGSHWQTSTRRLTMVVFYAHSDANCHRPTTLSTPMPIRGACAWMVVGGRKSLPTTIRRRSQSNRPKKSLQLFSIYLFLRFRKARMLAFSRAAAVLGFLPLRCWMLLGRIAV